MGKKLFAASSILSLLLLIYGFAYANKNGFIWKEFYNLTGETTYYPVSESTPKTPADDISAPETANIGDVFEGEDGYERVIAASKDGAYVTEIVQPKE
jgi:hypothetical protein